MGQALKMHPRAVFPKGFLCEGILEFWWVWDCFWGVRRVEIGGGIGRVVFVLERGSEDCYIHQFGRLLWLQWDEGQDLSQLPCSILHN